MDGSLPVPTHASVLEEIKALSKELGERVHKLSHKIPSDHAGKKFKHSIVPFTDGVNRLEAAYAGRIEAVAGRITDLSSGDWHRDKAIVGLWHEMANVVANFSEHPTKKVGALIIGKKGELLSYSANRVPPGIQKKARYYTKGIRKDFIVCAERLALAKYLGLSVTAYKGLPVHSRVKMLSQSIIDTGRNSNRLRTSYLMATVAPCHECRPAIAVQRPRGIFYDPGTGRKFTRDEGPMVVENYFRSVGITLHKLVA